VDALAEQARKIGTAIESGLLDQLAFTAPHNTNLGFDEVFSIALGCM
jgi:hypothetical protein